MSMVQRDTSTADIYAKQDNPYVDDPSVLDRGITQDKRKKVCLLSLILSCSNAE